MNIFKKLRNIFQKNDQDNTKMGTVIYMTDDLEHARKVKAEHPDVCVEYHSRSFGEPSPIHIYVAEEGSTIEETNPEYIEYLERKNPNMSEDEIYELMRIDVEKASQEWEKEWKKGFEEEKALKDSKPSPIHIYVMTGGRPIAKQNPEYIEYLERKNPNMSEDKIYKLVRKASEKKMKEWLKEHPKEWEYENLEDDEIEDSTAIEESKPKQKLKK